MDLETHKVVEKSRREDLKILKGIITGTIEYAEGRSNVHGPIKTGLANALKEIEKIKEKSTSFLKVPELRLGGESLGSRMTSMKSLASIASSRSMDSTSSMAQIADYRKAQQEVIEVRKEEEDHITKLKKKVDELIEDCQSAPKGVKRTK
ncbi:hypothetical protein TSAR_012162 [Trichomalopsis sarcophagae]|uniref:Uncharacterized protein n=1 Tax=Trichomalopsis sarcophagae TaxID=543379 RepID=A0A232FL75_9HYME|nr:hypothetical protein TSAR_012162 [Trichomalopsis sarcophagae]